ncbi:hypothetical protein HMPREF9454_00724 [Megamonas funiformis YIT 11815]|mgnify:CR=1 FL=1|jgi:hypothetical protein|uniref:Uncharacterized protein n=1 Tax=Megamonas funiformis YIT 11815 TaxID=742816 RepID=A0ABN0EJW5_9FIRM|nr:hypothetical protein HMPREF9454_00724 [Megamonas funiformis YIT 11815]
MLYLNKKCLLVVEKTSYLTLTNVVFELNKEDIIDINPENLTLTNVVFSL